MVTALEWKSTRKFLNDYFCGNNFSKSFLFMPINYPEVQHFSHLELLAKQVVEGFITGLHKSPFHGFSVEFAEHRLYNTGESTRHIDALPGSGKG
jgi:hypothetical protein